VPKPNVLNPDLQTLGPISGFFHPSLFSGVLAMPLNLSSMFTERYYHGICGMTTDNVCFLPILDSLPISRAISYPQSCSFDVALSLICRHKDVLLDRTGLTEKY
jgi:hypothetical protein